MTALTTAKLDVLLQERATMLDLLEEFQTVRNLQDWVRIELVQARIRDLVVTPLGLDRADEPGAGLAEACNAIACAFNELPLFRQRMRAFDKVNGSLPCSTHSWPNVVRNRILDLCGPLDAAIVRAQKEAR